MSKKIGRNDPCPCGSGKKYKNCCGKGDAKTIDEKPVSETSDLVLEDFVIEKLSEDVNFIENAVQLILGPYGYTYFEDNRESIVKDYKEKDLENTIERDALNVYSTTKARSRKLMNIRPYGGVNPEKNNDVITLLESGLTSGYQIVIFDKYLMDNLKKRFKAYYYLPSKEAAKDHEFTGFARRGYDFLLGITLYLELQLGVHLYYEVFPTDSPKMLNEYRDIVYKYYRVDPNIIEFGDGLVKLLFNYATVIECIREEYDSVQEVEDYYSAGILNEIQYKECLQLISPEFYQKPLSYDYIKYLRELILATVLNTAGAYEAANMMFPQCDLVRYLFGIEQIVKLFEDNTQEETIRIEDQPEYQKLLFEEIGITLEDGHITRKDIYDMTVFSWMDEINTLVNHFKTKSLVYVDFPEDLNADEYTDNDGIHNINPARRSTRVHAPRKLRMDLYNLLNGKCFTLMQGDNGRGTRYFQDRIRSDAGDRHASLQGSCCSGADDYSSYKAAGR